MTTDQAVLLYIDLELLAEEIQRDCPNNFLANVAAVSLTTASIWFILKAANRHIISEL